MTPKEYQERIRTLEEKICRQREDLARMYRQENAYINNLKGQVAAAERKADLWYLKYKDVSKRCKGVEEQFRTAQEMVAELISRDAESTSA